ncbi:MAG: post-PEP-CTERM-1 domain-containing protein [Stenotrophomonas sp.]|uniref:post-PEP-CTERM-1 domain-containing protein n=1 Tax=Stenotrophomonas sp. TaxID=69392 RepID=UPI0028AC9B86|nr:hypothetical protein [Stenotrophomonas sp.]
MKLAKPLLLLPALVLATASAMASEPPAPEQTVDNGMVAGIDAKTGKLRKLTDSEIRALSDKANAMAPASRSAAGTNAAWARIPQTGTDASKTLRVQSNGMTTADLPLSSLNALTVERAADGSVQMLENGASVSHDRQEVSK